MILNSEPTCLHIHANNVLLFFKVSFMESILLRVPLHLLCFVRKENKSSGLFRSAQYAHMSFICHQL